MSPTRPEVSTGRAWRPVLSGDLAARALAVVDEIAIAIAPLLLAGHGDADLAHGPAGGALLFGELQQVGRPGLELPTAARLVEEAYARCDGWPLSASLWNGTAGIAYAAALAGTPPSPALVAQLTDCVRCLPCGRYDLTGGATGAGVLALELLPDPVAAELLQAVVAHLAATAERRDGGLSWSTSHPHVRTRWRYDLGMAHGVSGIVAMLAAALASPSAPAATADLLEGAVKWTLAQRLDGVDGSCFPGGVGAPAGGGPARLAWCYGDAGLAVALLLAARALADDRLQRVAHEVALRAAARPLEGSGVIDAGVCHGAAGLAHLFGRMWQLTADEHCAAAAREWLGRTLALRRPALAVAGFPWMTADDADSGVLPHAEPGLLVGAAGVGLVLLAACSGRDPCWDHALLASHPFL